MTVTLYEILEVSARATPETIRAAFRSLMQRHHPDKRGASREAGERARELLRAYEVLSDAEARAVYDLRLAQEQRAVREQALLDAQDARALRGLASYAAHSSAPAYGSLCVRI